jgi:hypothetical protein
MPTEENKVKADMMAEDTHVMMMDPRVMDVLAKEFWKMNRMEIMKWRTQEYLATMAGGGATVGGGDDYSGGGGTMAHGDDGTMVGGDDGNGA